MTLRWVSVDLLTGAILADLPGIEITGSLRRTLGQYETATVALHVTDDIDPNWERAVLEGGAALIAYSGDPGAEVVEWGGIVLQSPRDLTNTVQISLVTAEGYLDRCYVGAYSVTSRNQNLIVTDLIAQFAANAGRIPIATAVVGAAGTNRDRNYAPTDNVTVYSALTELMGVSGGPEWSIGWVWAHNPDLITPVLTVGTRLGNAARPGLAPNATFEPGTLVTATIGHDYSSGIGANVITAYSGDQTSTVVAGVTNGRPLFEYRWTPSTSIKTLAVLTAHANAALANMTNGGQPLTLVVERDLPGLVYGVDWWLGDDVGYALTGPSIPNGYSGIARVVAVEIAATTVAPVLAVIA